MKKKNELLKFIFNLKWISLLSLLLFFSCQKGGADHFQPEQKKENQEILDYLIDQGFDLDLIDFKKDGVIYDRDAIWPRSYLLSLSRGELQVPPPPVDPDLEISQVASTRQVIYDFEANLQITIASDKVNRLLYFIQPSVAQDCGSAWVNAVRNAIQEWEDISHCRVAFIESNTEAGSDITFASDLDPILPASHLNIPAFTVAAASSPLLGGIPGRYVCINVNPGFIVLKKKAAMMHEIGHTLGFMHLNQVGVGTHLFGTPVFEANSPMNPYIDQWTATFRRGDLRAARLMFPDDLITPSSVSITKFHLIPGTVKIRYRNVDFVEKPYYWLRIYKWDANGNFMDYKDVRSNTLDNNGWHTVKWTGHGSGTFQFAIKGFNFKQDVGSWQTVRQTVTL